MIDDGQDKKTTVNLKRDSIKLKLSGNFFVRHRTKMKTRKKNKQKKNRTTVTSILWFCAIFFASFSFHADACPVSRQFIHCMGQIDRCIYFRLPFFSFLTMYFPYEFRTFSSSTRKTIQFNSISNRHLCGVLLLHSYWFGQIYYAIFSPLLHPKIISNQFHRLFASRIELGAYRSSYRCSVCIYC